ncbi:putative non-specific serine/threonine protein kinase [Helianthus debilis subsp. tardiflorus]
MVIYSKYVLMLIRSQRKLFILIFCLLETKLLIPIFFYKIKNGCEAANDPEVFETLLEAIAGIMVAADINGQLFLSSPLLLLDQLDNPYVTMRMCASKMIHRSCFFHLNGGLKQILAKSIHICNKVYDYLSLRLANSPKMVEEIAATLLEVKATELVKKWFMWFFQSL